MLTPEQIAACVLYEDNHLLVLNKPAGTLAQGDKTEDAPLAEYGKQYIKKKYAKPGKVFLGVIHRLDRPVSGVIIFARTSKALQRMNALFQQHEMEKIYWVLTRRPPSVPESKIIHWLVKDEKKNKTTAYPRSNPKGKYAALRYRVCDGRGGLTRLEVMPCNGRPHQIRAQLSAIGCPIVGDLKYGDSQPNPDKSICLHARRVAFRHPVTQCPITIEAAPPDAPYWNLFR